MEISKSLVRLFAFYRFTRGSVGHIYWPMIRVTHLELLTHLTHCQLCVSAGDAVTMLARITHLWDFIWRWRVTFVTYRIGINLPPRQRHDWSTSRSRGQRSRSHEAEVRIGGLPEISFSSLDPSSRVDRGIQSASKMLPMKRDTGCWT